VVQPAEVIARDYLANVPEDWRTLFRRFKVLPAEGFEFTRDYLVDLADASREFTKAQDVLKSVLGRARAADPIQNNGKDLKTISGSPSSSTLVKPLAMTTTVNCHPISPSGIQTSPQDELNPIATQPTMELSEFHRDLCRRFRDAKRAVPTDRQARTIYDGLGAKHGLFLQWLSPPKLRTVRHPGVLPSLLNEFLAWVAAEPPTCPSASNAVVEELERSEALKESAQTIWETMSDDERTGRRTHALERLQSEVRWARIPLEMQRLETTRYVMADLMRELDENGAVKSGPRKS
jgi:hypothetical protein